MVGFFFLLIALCTIQTVSAYEIDLVVNCTAVIDCESFKVQNRNIKFADITTTEEGQEESDDATLVLSEFLVGEIVYLDTDTKSDENDDENIVSVVYVEYNSTHFINLNYFISFSPYYETLDDATNDFDPNTWNLIEERPQSFNISISSPHKIPSEHNSTSINEIQNNLNGTSEANNNHEVYQIQESNEIKLALLKGVLLMAMFLWIVFRVLNK